MIPFNTVSDAYHRIQRRIHTTPIVTSQQLNDWLGHNIVFKAECLQKVGAFKARGGCNAVAHLVEQGQRPDRIIAQSSGNHAQAVAWAARQYEIPATIYMPETASRIKMQATRSYGAEVVTKPTRKEIDDAVAEAANQSGTVWIPPFNHQDVIAGQGTAALEVFDQYDKIDAMFAPCGGGGLLSGTLIVARHMSRKTQVIGVEPLMGNDAAQSLRAKKIIALDKAPETLADGARTLSVGDITFDHLQQLDDFYEVDEANIIYWTQWLTHLLKLTIEPTSAMTLQGVVSWLKTKSTRQNVVVILSGSNLDAATRNTVWQNDHLSQLPSLNDT